MIDLRDKIICDLMSKIVNPPIFIYPPSKFADDLDGYRRMTKAGLRELMGKK